jgi:regulatory protein
MSKFNKNMSFDKAREKAMRYCSFQERCQLDLINRFRAWNVEENNWDKILDYLIDENFLNEQRYVAAFIRGKFKMKKWGRNKIKMGLVAKRAYNESQFNIVFDAEIDTQEYLDIIKELLKKKSLLINEADAFKKRNKLYGYMLTKGYESELIVLELDSLVNKYD